jgi:hypothetical protein
MEETLLREILEVQSQILAELRLLRQTLAQQPAAPALAVASAAVATPKAPEAPETVPVAPVAAAPNPAAAVQTSPVPAPEPAPTQPLQPEERPAPQQRQTPPQPAGTMLTMDELADLGGQFLDPGQKPRGKVKPVEAADLLRDIKAKNKAKSSAFSAFDRFGRNR